MRKQILTGTESFERIVKGNYFYVDKTLFIKEFLENRGAVTLITRPRRFGKTMNMSMLEHFFDIRKDSRALFEGLKIMEHTDIVEKHLNQYPVISLTLKNVELETYQASLQRLRFLISGICMQNMYLLESDILYEPQKQMFNDLLLEKSTDVDLQSSLLFLTECLYAYHKKRVVVLMDEYDAPITNAMVKGYYQEMIDFMRGFMGCVFKTNDNLEFGVLTGVQRISRESLVSGFNNPEVCGITNKSFATCFGFTEEEVKEACEIYELGDRYDEVKKWYDGYRIGGQDMYNPWSIIGYLKEEEIGEYWVNTGSMQIIQDVFYKGDDNLKNELAALLTGAPVMMFLEDGITYPIKYVNSDTFWTMLLYTGYIKPCIVSTARMPSNTDKFAAELVNLEVKNMFTRYAKNWFGEQQPSISETILEFVEYLLQGDAEAVSDTLNYDLLNNPSSHDFKMENSYHMFIYGILLAVSGNYTVHSNPEIGKGRSDCIIKPVDKSKSAVIVEFKHVKKPHERAKGQKGERAKGQKGERAKVNLKLEALQGLQQIEEKAYIHTLKQEGYTRIFAYGIAFHKKTCEVAMESLTPASGK